MTPAIVRRFTRRLGILQSEIANVHAAALILASAGLASRLLGMLRDRLLAQRFGAGRELDVYAAAFNIPDTMSVLFLLGAASAAILPVFQERMARDRERAREFIAALAVLFLAGSCAVSLAAFFAAPLLSSWIAPGFSPAEQTRTALLARLMLFSPILLGLSGIFSVVVQSFQRFAVYAAAPLLYNTGIIFGILVLAPSLGITGVAAGVVIGALLHTALQIQSASLAGFGPDFFGTCRRLKSIMRSLDAPLRRVALLALPRVLSVSLAQLTLLVLDAMASTLAAGSVIIVTFAQNLYFVPIGIFGVSYATAIFPRLAVAASERAGEDFFRELAVGIRSILFWAAPSVALFIVLRAHIVRAVLGAGRFSWEDTRLTAAVLAAMALAIAAGALQTLLIRAYYALGNTWIPLAINGVASLISIALAFWFSNTLGARSPLGMMLAAVFRIGDLPHPEVLGLGLGFASGLMLDAAALYAVLALYARKKLGAFPLPRGADIVKIMGAAVVGGVVAYAVRSRFSEVVPLTTLARVLTQGLVAGGAGWVAYIGALTMAGSEEAALLRRVIARRLFSLRMLPQHWDSAETK